MLFLTAAAAVIGGVLVICCRDNRDVRQCLLYRLSRCDELGAFKFICLVASPQDTYAPLHSAAMLPLQQQETPAPTATAATAAAAAAAAAAKHVVSPRGENASGSRDHRERQRLVSSASSSPSLAEALGGVERVIEGGPPRGPPSGPPLPGGPLGPPTGPPSEGDIGERGCSSGGLSECESNNSVASSDEGIRERDREKGGPQGPLAESDDETVQQQITKCERPYAMSLSP